MSHSLRPLVVILLLATQLRAAIWTGGGDGASWNDGANWADGLMPGAADPVWDIGAGHAVLLRAPAPGDGIVKRGLGTLEVGPGLGSGTSIEVEGGTVTWSEPLALGYLGLDGGAAHGSGLVVDLLEVAGIADVDLATLPGLSAGTVRLSGTGRLLWSESATANRVDVHAGTFDFGTGMIWPEIHLSGGTVTGYIAEAPMVATGGTLAARVEGSLLVAGGSVMHENVSVAGMVVLAEATVEGYLAAEGGVLIAPWAGPSRIEGSLHLSAGSALCWSLQDQWPVAPLIVAGELSSDYEMPLYFGLVDWTNPFWDEMHDVLFIDAWEGGIVTATFAPEAMAGEGEGVWSKVASDEGDLVLRWTPSLADVAAVPEPASCGAGLALAALGLALSSRRLRARPR